MGNFIEPLRKFFVVALSVLLVHGVCLAEPSNLPAPTATSDPSQSPAPTPTPASTPAPTETVAPTVSPAPTPSKAPIALSGSIIQLLFLADNVLLTYPAIIQLPGSHVGTVLTGVTDPEQGEGAQDNGTLGLLECSCPATKGKCSNALVGQLLSFLGAQKVIGSGLTPTQKLTDRGERARLDLKQLAGALDHRNLPKVSDFLADVVKQCDFNLVCDQGDVTGAGSNAEHAAACASSPGCAPNQVCLPRLVGGGRYCFCGDKDKYQCGDPNDLNKSFKNMCGLYPGCGAKQECKLVKGECKCAPKGKTCETSVAPACGGKCAGKTDVCNPSKDGKCECVGSCEDHEGADDATCGEFICENNKQRCKNDPGTNKCTCVQPCAPSGYDKGKYPPMPICPLKADCPKDTNCVPSLSKCVCAPTCASVDLTGLSEDKKYIKCLQNLNCAWEESCIYDPDTGQCGCGTRCASIRDPAQCGTGESCKPPAKCGKGARFGPKGPQCVCAP